MKVPARKRGKEVDFPEVFEGFGASMKVPTRRRGNQNADTFFTLADLASMKAPTQGGEIQVEVITPPQLRRLNESPRPKAGKCRKK